MNRFTFAGLVLFALLLVAPIASAQGGLPCLPWGDVYDPATMMLSSAPECLSRPADNAAALKPAGLAKPAPVEQFVPCGYGERLDPLALACQSLSTPAVGAEAKPAPVEQFVPCGYGERLDPLALACLSQPVPAAKAASKPAGLAAPAPAVIAEQGCPWGDGYNPMLGFLMAHGYEPACFSRPADNGAALKPAGLAAPVPAVNPDQDLSCLPWGGGDAAYRAMLYGYGYVPACVSQPISAAKATSKPAGLAAPAPTQEQFVPCGFGERLDPLALACRH